MADPNDPKVQAEIRAAVCAAKDEARRAAKKDRAVKARERDKNSGQKVPLILKFDRYLDKWRW